MIKTIKTKKNTFTLAATGGMICIYKQQFGREYYEDLKNIGAIKKGDNEGAKASLLKAYRLIWAMAKAADPTISDPEQWIKEFDEFPLLELLPNAIALLTESIAQTKREDEQDESQEPMTAENLVACCLSCGMAMNDINSLSIGFLLNSVGEFIKIKTGGKERTRRGVRKATQADFDAF